MSTLDYKPDALHVEQSSPPPPSSSYNDDDTKGVEASHIEDKGTHHTPAVNIIQNPLRVCLLFILFKFGRKLSNISLALHT